jgi:bacterioferritin (cytochrome b1)
MAEIEKRITFIINKPNFRDAITLTEDEYAARAAGKTEQELLDDLKVEADARYDTYLQIVEDAQNAVPIELTKEELQQREAVLAAELAIIQEKIVAKG